MATSDNIVIEIIKPEDIEAISPIAIDVYCESEPVTLGFHATPDDLREFLTHGVISWVNSGLSVMAKDTANDKIVGVMLCKSLSKDNALTFGSLPAKNEKSIYYQQITVLIESGYDPFKDDVTKVIEQALLAVHPDYRGLGIGMMMAKKCDELGITADCQGGMVSASNIATKKIFEKIGYDVVFVYPFNEFKVDGKSIIDISAGNGTTEVNVMFKRFETKDK